jgi:uncharacterized protein YigE (DUF2233 family)
MNTDQLLTHARARFDHEANKRTLQEKYHAKLCFAYNGGMWRAGPELIGLIDACKNQPTLVLLDMYSTPVQITDTQEFFEKIRMHWQEQMNAWLVEHEKLSKQR